MTFKHVFRSLAVLSFAALACTEKPKQPDAPPAAPPAAPASAGPVKPCDGCKIIEVQMITNETGNFFKPAKFEAHQGDVIRFTLVTGVHNVNFLPDSNHNATGLPPVSDMLQLPGQTKDILVNFPPGSYYFQCDPHAALGMVGRVKVEARD